MKGRKPKPTAMRLLEGNREHRPLPDDEPQPDVFLPKPPDHLDDEAQAEWLRIGPKLVRLGVMTELDTAALSAYCVAWSRHVDAEKNLRKYGMVLVSKSTGNPVLSPYYRVATQALADMNKTLTEFGLSPSSRTRVTAAEKPADDDPFEQFDGYRAQ